MNIKLPFSMIALWAFCFVQCAFAQSPKDKVSQKADDIEEKVIQWRRQIHEHPELSNREVNTSEMVAKHLKDLGIEVQTGIAHTGVVGLLKGSQPGPVILLRADMDALPVKERVDIPFASKVTTTYNDQEVGVMHACGHDTHVAVLMGVAEVLSSMKDDIQGTIKFVFQPAEEGAPDGEEGGADLMIKEGVLENPTVDVAFGLHINSQLEVNKIAYNPGGTLASVDRLKIHVKGKQVHGAYPWAGTDPVLVSAQIVNNLQSIVSRRLNILEAPAVVTVAMIHGGVRGNIIPEDVEMEGTIRSLDPDMQKQIHQNIEQIATKTAESAGAVAEVEIISGTPVTYNNPELTDKMLSSLKSAAGDENVLLRKPVTGGEDFAFIAEKVPSLFFFLGGRPTEVAPEDAPAHHTPDFYVDDSGLALGVKALCSLALDYPGITMSNRDSE